MTEQEALLYNNVLANLPSEKRISSAELTSITEHYRVKAILKKMESDGFVRISSETTDRSIFVEITPPGEAFRTDGGYVSQLRNLRFEKERADKRENIKYRNDIIRTWSPIIIGFGSLTISFIALNTSKEAERGVRIMKTEYNNNQYVEPDSVSQKVWQCDSSGCKVIKEFMVPNPRKKNG